MDGKIKQTYRISKPIKDGMDKWLKGHRNYTKTRLIEEALVLYLQQKGKL